MPYTVIIENKAQKEFFKLSPPHDNSVKKAIEKLEKVPRPSGAKKLSGTKDGYRVRVGD
jgi:mRNA interferase RelE/StbE